MQSILVFGLVVVTGFVCAGFLSSVYQLITKKTMSFNLSEEKGLRMLMGVLTLILTGPFVIMRNSLRAFYTDRSRGGWVAASAAISIFWSFVSGLFLMNIYITAMV